MRVTSPTHRRRAFAAVAAATVVAPLSLGAASANAAPALDQGERQTYIVQLEDDPVATYTGGIRGLAATAPAEGEKVDTDSRAAEAYEDHLATQQEEALGQVGLDEEATQYEYTVAFNGFSAEMTTAQAARLHKVPGVLNVWEDEIREADTITTPDYLGMTGEDGVWNTYFDGAENAGAGIVVGVIDTGLWPENPSFAPLPDDVTPPATFTGICDPGVETEPARSFSCNNKVIGARYYAAQNTIIPAEFRSPRDYNGHGSHTAGTAAGNADVEAEIGGVDVGTMSGMAPAAHIAVYKALWQTAGGGGTGSTAGLVAAINDATADGVDVINYSISGSRTSVVSPDEIAFLNAANAGVFVATSAGNSGDTVGESSVAHNSPWTTTVAASTHDRNSNKTVTLGADDRVQRVAGRDRYGTAAAISRAFPEGVDTVYVTTGQAYADALAGSSPASRGMVPNQMGTLNTPEGKPAPVLLVKRDGIPAATHEAIDALGPAHIVILGGETAVSGAVEDELEQKATVTRVGGANRYETAALLAEQYGQVDRVYVATGEDRQGAFADALSGAALAGTEGVPVLLTRPDSVPAAVTRVLRELGDPEVVVLGGPVAVSNAVYDELDASSRLAGANRYGTTVAIAQEFGYDADNPAPVVHVATGADYPDALAGSALAGHQGVPVVLTRPDEVPAAVLTQLEAMDPGGLVVLGGPVAVSDDVEAQLDEAFPAAGGATYDGVGVGEAVGPAPLVSAADAARDGVSAQAARECWQDADDNPGNGQQPTLDPDVVEGAIVICDRGSVDRVQKSAAVAEAGGVGMIQTNTSDEESLDADYHSVPSIHVTASTGAEIKAYEAADADPTAVISADGQGEVVAPEMAGFSSYGPALAGGGDLLKPDITAPGVDVIAAVAPPGNAGEDFFGYSGTSMSTPHIAGLAALMVQQYPQWSVAAVKSAMMTTATPLNSAGEPIQRGDRDATALDHGSGEVRPGEAYGPGLVYDADVTDWVAYACAIGQASGSACQGVVMDPSDLNYPSIAIGDLAGTQTVTRTVTNVSGAAETYVADVDAPDGIEATVTPASITVAPGSSATYEVELSRTDAPLNAYAFGSLTWVGDGGHEVRSPIAVRPVAMAEPEAEISVQGTSGQRQTTVTPYFTGELAMDVDGLLPSEVSAVRTRSDGPGGGARLDDGLLVFQVPEGATHLRAAIFDEEQEQPGTDLDLYLATASGQIIASSGAPGSDEEINLPDVAAGTYLLAIDYWNGAAGATLDVPAHVFLLAGSDEGNLGVTPNPAAVVSRQDQALTLAWDGLETGGRYLASLTYEAEGQTAGRSMVSVVTR